MKVFIVFSAIFMMGLTCIVYQGDMNAYMHEQETLKMIAEEAACRAALELDESAYGMGEKRFDEYAAESSVAAYVSEARRLLAYGGKYEISFKMSYEDDEHGYSLGNDEEFPAVIVSVRVETDDFFRLPFLHRNSITRKSKYEIKGL